MKLKSLLLSSAAAIVATGSASAQAADVIVEAEPEPVEYVRVCDAYGAGFFYIPGSETCLRFDGYARYQINVVEDVDNGLNDDDDEGGFNSAYRFRLNMDARSEIEWGTLRAFGRFEVNGGDEPAAFTTDQVVIDVGGFHAGFTESAFAAPWGGLGIAGFGILHTDGGGSYGYQSRNQIGYNWAGANGWAATITLEDDGDSETIPVGRPTTGLGERVGLFDAAGNFLGDTLVAPRDTRHDDNYIPDVAGVVGFSQAWGGVWAKGGYDESDDAGTVMAGVQVNVPNVPNSSFKAGVFYATDPNAYAPHAPGMPAGENVDTEWSVAASYRHWFTPAFRGELGGQFFEDFGGRNSYLIQGAVVWVPVEDQFDIRLESHYADNDANAFEDGIWTGFLRFQRYF